MPQFFWNVLGALWPPEPGADATKIQRWRFTVMAVTMANAVATTVSLAMIFGAVPAVFAGFAPMSANAAQQAQLDTLQKNQLDSKIMDTRARQCASIKLREKGDANADGPLRFATGRLQEQLDEYQRLTRDRYRLPDCSEV